MSKIILVFFFASLAMLLLYGCALQDVQLHTKEIFALNTFLTFRVYGGSEAAHALDAVVERIHEIETLMSISIEESDVARINDNAGIKPVTVHEDTFYVINRALEYAELTDGMFDITIYPIARLWGIGTTHARMPDESEIQDILHLVNYQKVLLNKDEMTVFLQEKGMGIDLGGIAKGFAADEAAALLRQAGVEFAIINMGGSITTIGSRPDGNAWRIGIRSPRMQNGGADHMAVLQANDLNVLSAGDYERYLKEVYETTGLRYHHIFDPFTGYPADSGVIAATVVSRSAIEADALSTAILVMGAQEGIAMIERIDGAEALAITSDKYVFQTVGLKGKLEITDDSFKVSE